MSTVLELAFETLDKAFEAYCVQLKIVEGNIRRLNELAERCSEIIETGMEDGNV